VGVTHETDVGYDLQSSLMVSDRTGLPLAPVAQRLVSADGIPVTRQAPSGGSQRLHPAFGRARLPQAQASI